MPPGRKHFRRSRDAPKTLPIRAKDGRERGQDVQSEQKQDLSQSSCPFTRKSGVRMGPCPDCQRAVSTLAEARNRSTDLMVEEARTMQNHRYAG
jgi:hypothetical protein